MKILVVDDAIKLTELIENRLKKEGYIVDTSFDGEDALYKAKYNLYDLIILDVMLPFIDGYNVLDSIRENNLKTNVIMLTAKSELDDKINGFNKGADDYLTKPFHMEELVARVNAKLKKDYKVNNDYLEYGDIQLDLKKKKIICTKTYEEIDVLCKEFQLLEYLIKNKEQVLSKDQLYDRVWGIDNDSLSNNLEAYVSFIRKKLKYLNSLVTIKSIRGLGYKLEFLDE